MYCVHFDNVGILEAKKGLFITEGSDTSLKMSSYIDIAVKHPKLYVDWMGWYQRYQQFT